MLPRRRCVAVSSRHFVPPFCPLPPFLYLFYPAVVLLFRPAVSLPPFRPATLTVRRGASGDDFLDSAVYGRPSNAQHVYLPYYEGQMELSRKWRDACSNPARAERFGAADPRENGAVRSDRNGERRNGVA